MRVFSFLLLACVLATSCGDDLPTFDNKLQLDGENATAPVFNAGSYENAAYYSASIMEDKVDRRLREVEFYLYNMPTSMEIIVYGEGSVTRPGDVLYSGTMTSNLRENRWNTHVLSEPLTLDGNPIWISVKFGSDIAQQIIGCDAGPRVNGGDHFFNVLEGGWTTYQAASGESINWNIRGELIPE